MATRIRIRLVGEAERLRVRAFQHPVLSVEDQVSTIFDAWKAYRKPGLEHYFHNWADHAPAGCFEDRQHIRNVRVALEAQGFIFED